MRTHVLTLLKVSPAPCDCHPFCPGRVIPIGYILRELCFADKITYFSLDLEHQKNYSNLIFSFTCGRNISLYGCILLSKQWVLVPTTQATFLPKNIVAIIRHKQTLFGE